MVKIVVTQDLELSSEQIKRLKKLGDVKMYNDLPKSADEWVKRCKGADIVCSGKFGLRDRVYEVKNAFFSLRFVGVGFLDKKKLKENKITVAYSPGCNKDAVSEWIIASMLNLMRQLPKFIRTKEEPKRSFPEMTRGLTNKTVCILGKGNIGSRVGKVCKALDMKVNYFRRGDDLYNSVKDADIVVDCLGGNESTYGLLDKKFFNTLKKGSYFITVTGPKICDVDAMLNALDKGILAGAAHDAGGIRVGDVDDPFYQKLLKHPKVLVTPHVSFNTDVTAKVSNDMMIENIEAWLKGKPINIIK